MRLWFWWILSYCSPQWTLPTHTPTRVREGARFPHLPGRVQTPVSAARLPELPDPSVLASCVPALLEATAQAVRAVASSPGSPCLRPTRSLAQDPGGCDLAQDPGGCDRLAPLPLWPLGMTLRPACVLSTSLPWLLRAQQFLVSGPPRRRT